MQGTVVSTSSGGEGLIAKGICMGLWSRSVNIAIVSMQLHISEPY